MTKANTIYECCTSIPTIFEIWIKEQGWIDDVYLEIDNKLVKANWKKSELYMNGRFSLFQVEYTFNNPVENQTAIFHYKIEGKPTQSEPYYYDVIDPFNDEIDEAPFL